MPANLTGLNVALPKHPSWTVKLGHVSHHCTSVMLTSPWLRKWTFAQSTEPEDHLCCPFPVIRKCYPFPTAKYQLLYWLEPVELNQGAELCFLTFLKFLKDKQVLSDRVCPWAQLLCWKLLQQHSPGPPRKALGIHWGAATGGKKRSLSHPFSALFSGLHEATNTLLLRLFQAVLPASLSLLT